MQVYLKSYESSISYGWLKMPKLDYSIDIHFPADKDNDDYELYEIQGKQFRAMVNVVVRDTRGNRDVTHEYSVGAQK